MKILLVALLLLASPVQAKMRTFLRGPDFDWNRVETITTTTHLPGGLVLLRVEYVNSGCVMLIVPNSGIIVNKTELCTQNDKYFNERTPSR